jgi:uncharacterized protein (DUF433 family)
MGRPRRPTYNSAVARPVRRLDGDALEAFFEFRGPDEIKIKGRRVWLEHVLLPYRAGYAVEQLRLMFPTLKPREIEAAIRYYELHRERIDRYLDAAEAWAREARRRQREQPDEALARFLERAAPLRARLKAGHGGRAV